MAMNLDSTQRRVIERIVNVFETGSVDGDYGAISIYHDGPHDIRQITYGRSQTTEYGKLRLLVQQYVDANGFYSADLAAYADDVGSIPLTDDLEFRALLRKAGREDPVMRAVQDDFFEEEYFLPALAWANEHEFELPLSALVIYDSFIHSGSILWVIRASFPESPPSAGGNERKWTREYVNARHKWLAAHPRAVVRRTIYRTRCFKREIDRDNWNLAFLPIRANGVAVSAQSA